MLRKLMILSFLIGGLAWQVSAQDEKEEPAENEKKFKKENLFFGGNFGFGFGSGYTLINISPQVGYRFNKYLAAGTGINFIYSSSKFFGFKENYGVAGLNIFGRFYPIEQILLQVQPELNYTWGKQIIDGGGEYTIDGKFVPSLLVGAGASIPLGGRGAMIVMLQYDVLQQPRNPYGRNAFVTIGFNF
ncbi:MAG TPA: hypothetical protein VGD17_15590 [Chitinophagaceae bacterium]